MAAAKKAAAKKTAPSGEVRTVSEDTTGGVPGISPELVDARDALLQAEQDAGTKDANGGLIEPETEIGIDPALVQAREDALKAEQNRTTY